MRKKYLALSFLVTATLVFPLAGLFGCKRQCEARAPGVIDYKPLFPVNTSIVGVQNIKALTTNIVAQGLNNAITGKFLQVSSAILEEVGISPAASAKSVEHYRGGPCYLTGLRREDFNWLAFSVGNLNVLTNLLNDAETLTMPDFVAVLYTAKPVDPVTFTERAQKFACDLILEKMTNLGRDPVDTQAFDKVMAEFRDSGVAFEKAQWKGRPAMKLVFKVPEVTNNLFRFSPILARIGDGRLLALASSEEALGAVDSLYAGKGKTLAEEPTLAEVTAGGGSIFSAAAVLNVDQLVSAFLSPDQPVPVELSEFMPFLKALKGVYATEGTEGDCYFAEYALAFNDPLLASNLSSQVLMGKSAAGMLVALSIKEPSLQGAAMKIIDKISSSAEGGVLKVRISIPSDILEGIDLPAALKALGAESSVGDGAEESLSLDELMK